MPGGLQVCIEAVFSYLEGIVMDNIGEKGKKFMPLIIGLFMFIFISQPDRLIAYSRGNQIAYGRPEYNIGPGVVCIFDGSRCQLEKQRHSKISKAFLPTGYLFSSDKYNRRAGQTDNIVFPSLWQYCCRRNSGYCSWYAGTLCDTRRMDHIGSCFIRSGITICSAP